MCADMLFCGIGALLAIWTMVEGYILIEDIKEIANDLGADSGDVESAENDIQEAAIKSLNDSPVIQFFLFTSLLVLALRIAGFVLKIKKHGFCC